MRDKHNCISPDKGILAILFVCAAISGIMVILGYDDNVPRTAPPIALLCISLLNICYYAKTIEFSNTTVKIKHILFTRTVAWEQVRGIEFACQQKEYYIFICLENCPFWCETNMKIQSYTLAHPLQLVSIRISEDQCTKYKEIVQKYCDNILVTGQSRTGDGGWVLTDPTDADPET